MAVGFKKAPAMSELVELGVQFFTRTSLQTEDAKAARWGIDFHPFRSAPPADEKRDLDAKSLLADEGIADGT